MILIPTWLLLCRVTPFSVFSGYKMYAVGVGNAVEDELKEIASEPTGEHYFYTADFKAMTQIAKKLQINVCPGLASAPVLAAHTCCWWRWWWPDL